MAEQNLGAKIYLILIGSALALIGGFFVVVLWKGFVKAKETHSWAEVPAVIMESAVQERVLGQSIPIEYSLKLTYEYRVDGKSYFGERLRRRENPWSKEKAKAEVLAGKFRAGQQVTAFVNPEKSDEALLEHETKAPGYSIWFPGLFVVGGLGIVIRTLTRKAA